MRKTMDVVQENRRGCAIEKRKVRQECLSIKRSLPVPEEHLLAVVGSLVPRPLKRPKAGETWVGGRMGVPFFTLKTAVTTRTLESS